MPDLFRYLLIAALIFAALFAVSWFSARARPAQLMLARGRIAPNRVTVLIVAAFSLGFAALALTAAARWNGGTGALVVGLGFGLGGLVVATALTPAYDVAWDAVSLEGPASYGIWPFGPRRARLNFDDITGAGTDLMGSWFVADASGTRIRWNYTYAGYPALMQAIAGARSDLFPPQG